MNQNDKDLQDKINNLPYNQLDLDQDYTFNPDEDKFEEKCQEWELTNNDMYKLKIIIELIKKKIIMRI